MYVGEIRLPKAVSSPLSTHSNQSKCAASSQFNPEHSLCCILHVPLCLSYPKATLAFLFGLRREGGSCSQV